MRVFIEQLAGPRVKQDNKFIRPDDRRGQHLTKGGGQHPGLLLQRYLCENATGEGGNPEEKRAILQAAINAARNDDVQALYQSAFDRWSKSFPKHTASSELQTAGRLIVGLGSENVLETGLRLHHTYGMPIVPGSALKGLAAHYSAQIWGSADPNFKKPTPSENDAHRKFLAGDGPQPEDNFHRLLFGNTDDSGCIVFHDAWFVPGSEPKPLKLDVMTPHHPDYNRDPEKDQNFRAPTDFDSPTPIPFLSVTGNFLVAVSWHGPEHDQAAKWTELALSLLRDALFEWGVGGKTSSGYGRFDKARWEESELQRHREAAQRQQEAEEAAALAAMTPLDRKIKEFLDNHPNQAETRIWFKLYEALKAPDGPFQEHEERIEIAKRVEEGMRKAKVWKDKDKNGVRKKFIENILGNSP